ncbi:hypothetical protein [Streptomyces sp. NPDC056938]
MKSVELIASRIAALDTSLPLLMTGDFRSPRTAFRSTVSFSL